MKTLVLGVGQLFRGDDAAGLEAVRIWQENYPQTASRVKVEASDLPGLALLDILGDFDALLVVDSIISTSDDESPRRLDLVDLNSFSQDTHSMHGWSISGTLQLGKALNPKIANLKIILIGIPGEEYSLGASFSSKVQRQLVNAADMIEGIVQELLNQA